MIDIKGAAAGLAVNQRPMVLFENVLAQGTLVASSETSDGLGTNAVNGKTNNFWTPSALSATLSVTLGASADCDCAAIVGHTLGSTGTTLHVEYLDGSWTGWSLSPTTDEDILMIFPENGSTQWRIRLTGSTAPSIAVAMIGKRLVFPCGLTPGYIPISESLDIELLTNQSRVGSFIGNRVRYRGASGNIDLTAVEKTWKDANLGDFQDHYNDGGTFIFASGPEFIANDMAYCWRRGDTLKPAIIGPGLIFFSLSVDAYVG